jgi:hypothetical protein
MNVIAARIYFTPMVVSNVIASLVSGGIGRLI